MRGTVKHAIVCGLGSVVAWAGISGALERDPAQGQFYSQEELMKLGGSERDDYCEAMETLLTDLQEETVTYTARLDSMQVMADTLRSQTLALSDSIRQVNNELRELRLKRKTVTSFTTKGGETVAHVAKILYGDANRATELMEANKSALTDHGMEDPLPAGLVIQIPR
jgi:nucleoid-associated protein YgaU